MTVPNQPDETRKQEGTKVSRDRSESHPILEETTDAANVTGDTSQSNLDDLLESCLDKLVEIAPVESPERLSELLPQGDPAASRFILVELIKMDMAIACEQSADPKSPPTIEDYLEPFSDLLSKETVPVDLVMEELQLRREIGATVKADEYQRRFPEHRSVIGQLLGVAEATAAVQNRRGPPSIEIGSRLDDFLIVQTLGSGAFANVYLARQVSMHRLVALKVSRGTGDEPQALAQFDHPNIVRVFDQREIDGGQIHLLYMQYLPGGTLADVLKLVRVNSRETLSGSLLLDTVDRQLLRAAQAVPERSSVRKWLETAPWPMVVAWVGIQLSRALAEAHERDVLHRDVKPANVLLSAEAIPKLADFNVSFAGSAGRAGAAASFGGSIGYMSPEHLRAINATALTEPETVAERADLYSLAILLWELWQGIRPFDTDENPSSWTDAVEQQLAAREKPLPEPKRGGGASERVLEKTLQLALQPNPDDRPASGTELAGRLKLALHPEAAKMFDPDKGSWRGWLMRQSPWLIAGLIILVPNLLAGVYGYLYNHLDTLGPIFREQAEQSADGKSELESKFMLLSMSINLVAFPLALVLVLYFTKKVVIAIRDVEAGKTPSHHQLSDSLQLATRAAAIGGVLWCLAGVLYPSFLKMIYPPLTSREFSHFFFSHVICGGIAAIYPFYGMTVYATTVLYPKLVRISMKDDHFEAREKKLVYRSEFFLWLACLVPVASLILVEVSDLESDHAVLVIVLFTALGFFAAFYAYKGIVKYWELMGKVISSKSTKAVVPLDE